MKKFLIAALAAVSATALLSPSAYAQRARDRGEWQQRREDGDRSRDGWRLRDSEEPSAPDQRSFTPPVDQAPARVERQDALSGPHGTAELWRREDVDAEGSLRERQGRDSQQGGDFEDRRNGGDWRGRRDGEHNVDPDHSGRNDGGRGDWNGRHDGDGRGDWNGRHDGEGRGDWNGRHDGDGRGDWNGRHDGDGRGDWNGRHDGDGRGDWNWRRDNGDDWRGRGDNYGRDDWGRGGRHGDWRRDDHGQDWRHWNWRGDDHRYDRWRNSHRDFRYPRYRDWRGIRYGYYFDPGYARIVSGFFGYNYYWWSYPNWRRPHRPYAVGYYLPDWVYWEPVPWDLYYRLPPAPYGCRYIMVERDILLISLTTGIILDALLYY